MKKQTASRIKNKTKSTKVPLGRLKNLVFVESPAKSRTIEGFLGKDFTVLATLGHIKDLPKKDMGVDIQNNFEPSYVVAKGRKETISKISNSVKNCEGIVYIATDPDREGEAIGWQVSEIVKKNKKDSKRIVFHEITKEAVLGAIENPGEIDMNMVYSQQARRILDRLVGYELSGLIWKKIRYGLSAGRVQSVALRIIVEREKERLAFKSEKFWNVNGEIDSCVVSLINEKGKPRRIKDDEKDVLQKGLISPLKCKIESISDKKSKLNPPPPLMTSTLQRLANNMFGYSASKTMQIAQKLYQGVNIKGKGAIGLITYMRTDSLYLANKAVSQVREYIKNEFGVNYLNETPRVYKNKSKVAQEAHEAIRPTHFDFAPNVIKSNLSPDEFKIYSLIWDRTIATQMGAMEVQKKEVVIKDEQNNLWGTNSQQVVVDGFGRVLTYVKKMNESGFPEIINKWSAKDVKEINSIEWVEKETQPKPRYTEASLVKKMEQLGIGRPSTYASIISTIKNRGYILVEKKYLIPTDSGIVVSDFLVKYFSNIVDYGFTAKMEDNLDSVANGKLGKVKLLKDFYFPFHEQIESGDKDIDKKDVVVLEDSDEKCPECGGKMVVKLGKNGRFLSCAKFPKCKGIISYEKEMELDKEKYVEVTKCEQCGSDMVLKNGKFGKFWACSGYPKCKNAKPLMLVDKCPECGSNLVERRGKWGKSFVGCSNYPKCRYIKK
ncbi:MAG TPA: type I DNA topoisomerase [Candidatus Dojkabacteria bacterium]|mgnify:CR=1 FL=1|nr:type I DNA topoisomerase [Candidatus Dojkabacteria bacterium]HQF36676.1 type I DNA topoisomerase [Candidatus Dojkabacteria bacterium]